MADQSEESTGGDRGAGMAAFIVAAIIIVIVFAAVNGQSIVHELRIAFF